MIPLLILLFLSALSNIALFVTGACEITLGRASDTDNDTLKIISNIDLKPIYVKNGVYNGNDTSTTLTTATQMYPTDGKNNNKTIVSDMTISVFGTEKSMAEMKNSLDDSKDHKYTATTMTTATQMYPTDDKNNTKTIVSDRTISVFSTEKSVTQVNATFYLDAYNRILTLVIY